MRQQLTRFESWLIHRKARQLIGEYGLTPSDLPDLEQDLAADLLRRLKDFDPRRAQRQTFAARVIEHAVAAIIEHRSAARRDWRRESCSLNESLEDEDGRALARYATVDAETGRPEPSSPERQDLAIEVRQAMARLPERLRRLAQCLTTRTPYEAIQELGIQLWADGEPEAGFRYVAHEIGQFGEYQTTEGILSAGATSFGFLTGPLKDYTVTNVKLTLRYTVVGAAAWAGLTYELRIRDQEFSAGLDMANSEGSQKTTWSQGADGSITKEITLAASDLFCTDVTDETHFLVAPVYTKPAFPGPASPNNDPADLTAGLQGITARLTYTI